MKWLFILLLIINVGIFTWGYQQEQIEKHPAVDAGSDVGKMRLISELSDEEKEGAVESGDQAGEESAAVEAKPAEDTQKPASEQAASPQEPAAAEIGQAQTGDKATTDKETVTEPETKTEQTPAVKVAEAKEKVTQPEEKPVEQAAKQQEKAAQTELEPGTVSRCGTIGPIRDRQVAKDIVDDLEKSNLEAKLERSIEKQQIGYWVVIPPMDDGSQAQAKIDELAEAGLKDIWHFRGGGMKNAISLGMFAKKENAENFSKEVLKKGFKTEMQPRFLNKTTYLVKFAIVKPKTVTEIMWRMVENKYSKMPFSEQSCEPIATE